MDETIVAIATPLGEGGLGVVRISGPSAFKIAEAIFTSSKKISEAPSHTLHHGWITGAVDEAVAAVFRSPHSYTGEDVVELSCHGSPAVLKEVVRLAVQQGARIARPGEFTERAYLNGKLDLAQAEAVADLIAAQSTRARAAATDQLRGALSERVNRIRETLIDLLARLEANLDFAEEEIPIVARDVIAAALDDAAGAVDRLLATSLKGRWLREGWRVALAGKPNVGKSSLFNALLAEDRAIVTDVPGTTRDTLEEKMDWDGLPVVLIDTAGLRSAEDRVEKEGTVRAERAHGAANAILFVVDGSTTLADEDRALFNRFRGKPLIVAINKSDKGAVIKPDAFAGASVVAVSAKEARGLDDLKRRVVALAGSGAAETESTPVVTNLRHVHHLEKAREKIGAARAAAKNSQTEEAIAVDLRGALSELGQITGHDVTEDVLSSIFRQFCIGK